MAKLTNFIIKSFGNPSEDVCNLEEARNYFSFDSLNIFI